MDSGINHETAPEPDVIKAELVEAGPGTPWGGPAFRPVRPRRRRVVLPIVFFVTTCVSTFEAGTVRAAPDAGWLDKLWCGLQFAVPLMTILVCHEMGHFLQAHRYRVPASLPYFIPMPSLIGTMGAIIFMEPRIGGRAPCSTSAFPVPWRDWCRRSFFASGDYF